MPSIQIRADLLFQFNHEDLGKGFQYRFFNLNEFVTRVEKLIPGEDNEVRYGVMMDFDGDESTYQKSYMLEIPASASDPVKRKEEQEKVITEYVDKMRSEFKSYFQKATQYGTTDEFDKVERQLASTDGLWSILREFRNKHLTSFSDWLFEEKFEDKEKVQAYLTRSKMTFETEKEYLISVDWMVPYTCFKDEMKVAHFDTDMKSADMFYPFHNYYWQKMELCTQINIERDKDYAESYVKGIELRPNNYAMFAYYTFLIDNVCKLQQENYDTIKTYYQYIQNLTAIQGALQQYGPLSSKSETSIGQMNFDSASEWDGDTSDGFWGGDNTVDFALGMKDIDEMIDLFNGVLYQESYTGRNGNRSVSIQSLAFALKQAFFDNEFAKKCYEDLWAFNDDDFAFNLILRKILLLLSQMDTAKDVYNEHLISGLYEHPVLDETMKGGRVPGINFAEWGNIFYRTNAITFETWMGYYPVREKIIKTTQTRYFNTRVVPNTPTSGQIAKWITETAVFPGAIAGSSTPSQLYSQWKLNDEQVRKLANYLLGGAADAKLKAVEEKLAVEIKRLFGTVNFKEVPFDRIDELHRVLLDFKRDLVVSNVPEANTTRLGHAANFGASALNLYLAKLAYDNAYAPGAGFENKLRAHTVAIGLFSDVANTVAKFRGVQSTLVRAVARQAGGRIAIGLGAAEFIGGGVGGALGVAWFAYDAYGSLSKGFQKDALLDSIAALGCAITTVGLFLDATVVGAIPGIICNVVGIVMVLASQLLKYFRAFNSTTEDYCKHLFGEPTDKGGMDRLKLWKDELKSSSVSLPLSVTNFNKVNELTERVESFLLDWDTFDHVKSMPTD